MSATFPRSPGTVEDGAPPLDTIFYQSDLLLAGRFRAPVSHPRFRDSGPIANHLFVFPRTNVEIRHEGTAAFLTDANMVTYYNRGQVYSRAPVDPMGDRCEWFAFQDGVVLDAVASFDPSAADRPECPFPFRSGPGDSACYWRQRQIVETLASGRAGDGLRVEEEMLSILARLLARAFRLRPASGASAARRHELAEDARRLISLRFREPLTLSQIARELETSPFHLSRVFRESTGWTLHAYRDALRLAASLEAVAGGGDSDLTSIALDLGYSSHSHFTAAFRSRFGLPPSRARQLLRR